MTKRVLTKTFFNRSAPLVARELIGKFLVRKMGRREVALMIVETEAYGGSRDLASHARSGKTKRNFPMFEEAGTIYVYFTYGMHWMLNIVTGKKEEPAAVLIRGVVLLSNTNLSTSDVDRLVSGPGRLTKALRIDKKLNTKKLRKSSGLWVEDRGVKIGKSEIKKTPRIGVFYAGEWAKKPYRFVLSKRRASTDLRRISTKFFTGLGLKHFNAGLLGGINDSFLVCFKRDPRKES